jgi:hypothetical protein
MQGTLARLRNAWREPSFKKGSITFPYSGIVIDCVVRNISERGACLIVDRPCSVPDDFDLMIGNDDALKYCRVVWRNSKQVGVDFL